jgi:gluconate 2-dehydrogenase gamma chain
VTLSRRQLLTRGLWLGGAAALQVQLPRALAAAAASKSPEVLSTREWKIVEAITARLIPTDHEPGAVEAGCVNFIDKALANEDTDHRPLYRDGLRGLDAVARAHAGKPFVALPPAQQDAVLAALEDGKAAGWSEATPRPEEFFEQVWQHTIWGFLADPKYGGNRNFAGWRVLGYPGGRHLLGGYTPQQMAGSAKVEAAWGEMLPRTVDEP